MKVETLVKKTRFKSKKFVNKHGSTILTIMASVGVIGTAILTADATIKALEDINLAEADKGEPLTTEEKIRTAAHHYILPVVAAASTITCTFGANVLNKKQQASLASAYVMLDKSYKEYRKKVVDICGKEVDEEVQEAISLDRFEEKKPSVYGDKLLFFEEISQEFFEATMLDIRNAEYHFNRNYALAGYATINELMDWFELPHLQYGDDFGWSWDLSYDYGYSFIDFEHDLITPKEGVEYYKIRLPFPPCNLWSADAEDWNYELK